MFFSVLSKFYLTYRIFSINTCPEEIPACSGNAELWLEKVMENLERRQGKDREAQVHAVHPCKQKGVDPGSTPSQTSFRDWQWRKGCPTWRSLCP